MQNKLWDKSWAKVTSFVQKYQMLTKGDRILLGLSGGADSVCLARYLLYRREELSLELYAVHVNHMLRDGEAGRDEAFVRDFCAAYAIPLVVEKRDIKKEHLEKKCSEEEAGRLARYECFEKYAGQFCCGKTAVAHHENDAAETVVFRMIRGTGVSGLAGIRPVNGQLIRPLLCLSKEEITETLARLGQPFVEDSTNSCEDYSRNFIRKKILPEMEQVNAKAAEHICMLGTQVQEMVSFLEPQLSSLYETSVERRGGQLFLSEKAFRTLHPFAAKEVLRRMLFEKAGRQKDISAVHIGQLLSLMDKKEGKQQDYPYGLLAVRAKDGILLQKAEEISTKSSTEFSPGFPADLSGRSAGETGRINKSKKMDPVYPDLSGKKEGFRDGIFFPERKIKVFFEIFAWDNRKIIKKDCSKYFDYDKIECKICLRTRIAGDYFIMDKEGRKKTLNRYFIDEKIPASDRDEILLLADGPHIMWIVGGRISEAFKISRTTKRVLAVSVRDTQEKRDGGC